MRNTLVAGLEIARRYDIDRDRTIDFMGEDLRVYSTPHLVRDMEATCRDLLMEHAEDDEDSVGAHMRIDHMGATLLGMHVDVTARVTEVDGPRVTFEIEAHDPLEQVGRAKHVRFVINKSRQGARLEKKARQVRELG